MASRTLSHDIICLTILFAFIATPLSARSLTKLTPEEVRKSATVSTLVARLNLNEDGSASNNSCWDSLFQLQSCTGEVILFFLNGETQLGKECCKAVGHIEEYCWPDMIKSLGFTNQEEEVLHGYCVKENASGH